MYKVLTLNKISAEGLSNFDSGKYSCSSEFDSPDAIIVRSASMHEMGLPESVLAVARAGAGVNNIPVSAYTEKGVVVFNTPGANANAVKELVICGLLLASRKIVPAIEWCATLKGKGDEVGPLVEKGKANFGGPEIKGKILGVFGLGAIGVMVANAAVALGMNVIGYDPYLTDKAATSLDKSVKITANLDDLFAQSLYITLHAPLTDATRGIIRAETFEKMPDGVRILNFARKELVAENDIIEALGTGKCAAYVTDFPSDSQLCVDGVIAIPHLGASTPESEENCAVMAVEELRDFLEKGEIVNSVNFPNIELAASEDAKDRILVLSAGDVSEQIFTILANNSIKVAGGASNAKKTAAALIETASEIPADVLDEIKAIDGVYRVRVVK